LHLISRHSKGASAGGVFVLFVSSFPTTCTQRGCSCQGARPHGARDVACPSRRGDRV